MQKINFGTLVAVNAAGEARAQQGGAEGGDGGGDRARLRGCVCAAQIGEFVEVFNESTTDPAAWLAKIKARTENGHLVRRLPMPPTTMRRADVNCFVLHTTSFEPREELIMSVQHQADPSCGQLIRPIISARDVARPVSSLSAFVPSRPRQHNFTHYLEWRRPEFCACGGPVVTRSSSLAPSTVPFLPNRILRRFFR